MTLNMTAEKRAAALQKAIEAIKRGNIKEAQYQAMYVGVFDGRNGMTQSPFDDPDVTAFWEDTRARSARLQQNASQLKLSL